MKIKTWILRIAFIIFCASLYFAIKTEGDTKTNNILIGIMGSSLVSFLIEVPDWYIGRKNAKSIFYNISSNIWFALYQYLFFINSMENDENRIVTENIFSPQVDQINGIFMGYYSIDEFLYSKNSKYNKFLNQANKIKDELNNNKIAFAYFFDLKKLELVQKDENRNLKPFDLQNEITELREKTESKLKLYETEFVKIMNQKELDTFYKNKGIIEEMNKNYKDEGVKFI